MLDTLAFLEHEREVIARRWRLFAPVVLLFLLGSEVAPYFTSEFPHSWATTLPMIAVIGAIWAVAWRKPSRAILGWASVATAIFAAAYIATPAAETGRFQSLHVLAMAVLIALVPGILSFTFAEAAAVLFGSIGAFVVVCRFWGAPAEVSYDGLFTSLVYLLFLAVVTLVAVQSNRRLRQREFVARREVERTHRFAVEEVLCRHLPPRYVERVLSGETLLDSPPERRVVTVLFADIVGFTPLCEAMPPDQLSRTVAKFYDATAAVAFEHGATIDKFIGDAVMAILGAPDAMTPDEQARRALAVASGWRKAVREVVPPGYPEVTLRIGIHQEQVAVGAFGGRLRSEYTVLGRGVNIAARLEQRCRAGEILISDAVFTRLPVGSVRSETAGELQLKGIPDPVRAHFILTDEAPRRAEA